MTVAVGVLISGSGTNLQALLDSCALADSPARIAVVISNRRDAYGLERARKAGIAAVWIPHRKRTRQDFEQELLQVLQEYNVSWVMLAGFMRVLTDLFLTAYPNRVLNIHPSILPSFPGINAQKQAFEAGVKVTGATVHFVDSGMDTGPIVLQGSVPVLDDDNIDSLRQRILSVEHQIFPQALRLAVTGKLCIQGQRVLISK